MKFALLSDIHANRHALDACLTHAHARQVDRFAFLGDLVGYGAHPAEVLSRIESMVQAGALCLQGNHDALAVQPPVDVQTLGDSTAQWTHAQLSAAQKDFLAGLPYTVQHDTMLLVHASADAPASWRYVTDERLATLSLDAASRLPQVRHVFGGHVHLQTLYYRGSDGALMKFSPLAEVAIPLPTHRHWLATLGSVGQPRDGNPQAMYAIFDTSRMQLTFHRVAYDHLAAAQAIRDAGLPEHFAIRLELGR
jgi:diadenosine tetraphosphatase ApaH/serine/threonine PP2A family protein phosphatase